MNCSVSMTMRRARAALGIAVTALAGAAGATERWGVWEESWQCPDSANPYTEVTFSATFSQDGREIEVPGFWDGGNSYRLRFSPPSAGSWRYVTRSNRPQLDNRRGAFEAASPSPGNHGPVEVFETYHLRYADGTPYHQFGTTCYAWVHQTEDLQAQTLKTLAASPFNKIRFCVFPKSYTYNQNEPAFFAFQKKADGKFDFNRPDPEFWRRFERRVLDLQALGIEADLILWHPYDRWGFSEMSKEQDDRYLRYCVARLSACRNVWWSLANEFDLMAPNAMKNHRGNKEMSDWDRFFQILASEDPHRRLRSIHNCRGFYDHTRPWVTHASLQTSDMNKGVTFRSQFRKPVIYDECKYEGDIPQGWGNIDARTMTMRFWLGTLSGCYVGHGETYKHPDDILWWSKGGVLHGQSPQRIQWLKDFMKQAPPFHELQPLGDDKGRFILAKPGEFHLLHCPDTRPQTVELPGDHPYKVDLIDPWEMTVTPLGTAAPGKYSAQVPRADTALRFIPYRAGEPLRPEVRVKATPSEGVPPLTVSLKAVGEATRMEWQFDDGSNAEGREITRTFTEPGVHIVTLKATGAEGAEAMTYARIATDRDVTKPVMRSGFASDELPPLKIHGSARRGENGSLLFSENEPWGWVQCGTAPLEELRGLRSFTVCGWLRPTSLKTGSGGNRILFCLNRDRDGIDLVCHADGRMRLAVNQWPDGIRNDSSPDKLIPHKWVFFAVTYDAGRAVDNVAWYFSRPLDAPGATGITLDRTNSYNNGPVGDDPRGLAVGNFNETMHNAGMDRQFRGEIRGLQLFGSRLGGRGALPPESLKLLTDVNKSETE